MGTISLLRWFEQWETNKTCATHSIKSVSEGAEQLFVFTLGTQKGKGPMEKVLRDYEMQMHEEYKYSYIDSLKFWHFPIFKLFFLQIL